MQQDLAVEVNVRRGGEHSEGWHWQERQNAT